MNDPQQSTGGDDERTNSRSRLSRRSTLGLLGLTGLSAVARRSTADASDGPASRQSEGGNQPWYRWENDVDANAKALTELGGLEMASNSARITDFAGENLSIEDGSLTAAGGSYLAYHDLDDYGADPDDPDHYDDEAFDAAVEAAESGDWIVMMNGTYTFGERHVMEKSLTVYGEGSTILSDTHDELGYPDDQARHYYPLFTFRGSYGDGVSFLEEPVEEGDHRVIVEDVSDFEVGNGVVVRNHEDDNPQYGTAQEPARVMGRGYRPSVTVVRDIDEDESALYLEDALKYDYEAGHNVRELDQLRRPTFLRLSIENKEALYFDEDLGKVMGGFRGAFATEYCREARVIECRASGYDSNLWTPLDDLNSISIDCTAENPMNLSGSCGEPFYVNGSSDIKIIRPVIKECRRGIDVRSGCKTLTVVEPEITEVGLHGLSFHQGPGVGGNMRVVGGKVHAKPTDPTMDNHGGDPDRRWEYQWSRGFLSTAEGRMELIDVDFVVRERGGRIYHEGAEFHIEGCTFRKVPRAGTDASFIDVIGSNVENVHISDTTFHGGEVDDGRTHPEHAVRLLGEWDGETDDYEGIAGGQDDDGRVRNVHIDAEIDGSFGGAAVFATDARDSTIDVDVRQGEYWDEDATTATPAVEIGSNCNRIDVTGTQRSRGSGVVVSGGNNKGIHVHDFISQSPNAAFRIDEAVEDGDVRDLKLVNVTARGENRVLDVNDTLVDGLHVVNFVGEGIQNFDETAQKSYAFTHLSGNNTDA